MMNNANEYRQEQRTRIKKLPLVSLTSGLFSAILFLLLESNNRFVFWIMEHAVSGPIFWVSCGLIIPVIGIICGFYYLITVKTWHPLERICAILGTSLLELWLCILWCEGGIDIMAEIFKAFF
jgi:uncharacterized membrane protein